MDSCTTILLGNESHKEQGVFALQVSKEKRGCHLITF